MHIVHVYLSHHVVLQGQQQVASVRYCRLLNPTEPSRHSCQKDNAVTSSTCTVGDEESSRICASVHDDMT